MLARMTMSRRRRGAELQRGAARRGDRRDRRGAPRAGSARRLRGGRPRPPPVWTRPCSARRTPCVASAMAGAAEAVRLIDMFAHHGGHPRMGAADVIPFMPVRGVTMDECVVARSRLRPRARGDARTSRSTCTTEPRCRPSGRRWREVRKGEFEGLRDAVARGERLPDFGPHAIGRAGATAVGARKPLVAFNVYLDGTDEDGGEGDRARRARVVGRPARAPRDRVRRARARRDRHRVDEPGRPRGHRPACGVRRRRGARRRRRHADRGRARSWASCPRRRSRPATWSTFACRGFDPDRQILERLLAAADDEE